LFLVSFSYLPQAIAQLKITPAEDAESCVVPLFSHTGSQFWQNITLSLTNQCPGHVDLDGLQIAFRDRQTIESIWYVDNGHTGYPQITTTSHTNTHTVQLAFTDRSTRSQSWLASGESVSLNYGAPELGYRADSVVLSFLSLAIAQAASAGAGDTGQSNQAHVLNSGLRTSPQMQIPKGRVIGYLPLNWNNSGRYDSSIPPAEELAAVGYTHILISFGVFSTNPGCIVNRSCIQLSPRPGEPAQIRSGDGSESQLLKSYITQLHHHGIQVLLSLGGAATAFGTVDFEESFARIQNGRRSFDETITAYVNSVVRLIQTYGFDGIDVDIEHGFTPASGKDLAKAASVDVCKNSFTLVSGLSREGGSVCAMVAIIRGILQQHAELLITLAPQTLNIAANNRVAGQTLNYTSLVANLREHITWVGVQIYNSGGMYGPRGVLQAITAENQVNATVAMALNLLEPWNQHWPNYFLDNSASILNPDQVVLGFPASNGVRSDGRPAGDLNKIKRAIYCLNQGNYCDSLSAKQPLAGSIGGVFNWNVNFDRANGYAFARALTNAEQKRD
jgi:chitinase